MAAVPLQVLPVTERQIERIQVDKSLEQCHKPSGLGAEAGGQLLVMLGAGITELHNLYPVTLTQANNNEQREGAWNLVSLPLMVSLTNPSLVSFSVGF